MLLTHLKKDKIEHYDLDVINRRLRDASKYGAGVFLSIAKPLSNGIITDYQLIGTFGGIVEKEENGETFYLIYFAPDRKKRVGDLMNKNFAWNSDGLGNFDLSGGTFKMGLNRAGRCTLLIHCMPNKENFL